MGNFKASFVLLEKQVMNGDNKRSKLDKIYTKKIETKNL